MRNFDMMARLADDNCAIVTKEVQNKDIGSYMLYNSYVTAECNKDHKAFENFVSENPNLRYKDGYGFASGCVIEADSQFRNGAKLTHEKEKSQLCTRWNQAVPSLNKGGLVVNVDTRLKFAEDTSAIRDCKRLAEVNYDRFTPLNSCLSSSVQDAKHIIPPWVNGGQSTRNYIHDNAYLQKCGFVNNGNTWMRA